MHLTVIFSLILIRKEKINISQLPTSSPTSETLRRNHTPQAEPTAQVQTRSPAQGRCRPWSFFHSWQRDPLQGRFWLHLMPNWSNYDQAAWVTSGGARHAGGTYGWASSVTQTEWSTAQFVHGCLDIKGQGGAETIHQQVLSENWEK